MPLDTAVEGVLFFKASAIRKTDLVKLFNCTPEELENALRQLGERLLAGGTRLIQTDSQVELVTAPELDELIDSMRRDELRRDIGKAGAETLAIILYRGPITRPEIDRIRGVNSSFIIRNLLIRGLVERNNDSKGHAFVVTPDLLAHLGITNKLELPDYASVMDQLEAFERQQAEAEVNNSTE
jgi:segregation and condensation protein B